MSETPIDSTSVETTPVKKPGLPRRTVILAGLLALVGIIAVVTTLKRVMTPAVETAAPVAAAPVPNPTQAATQPPAGAGNPGSDADEWRKRPAVQGVFATPPDLKLNEEQTATINAIKEELGPQVWNAMRAFDQSLTPQQTKARGEAAKVVAERGLKGQEAVDVLFEAMGLSEEQKRLRENLVKIRETAQGRVFQTIRPARPDKAENK